VTFALGPKPNQHPGSEKDAGEPFRLCVRCGQWKSQGEFHNSRTGQFSYCRVCRREYDRRYYAERGRAARRARQRAAIDAARAWMAGLKDGIPCADCGRTFPGYVMHWDHLPGFEKVAEISVLVGSYSRATVLAELEKCELVCANCHVMRTVTGHKSVAARLAI
jgi:hypothetical protein